MIIENIFCNFLAYEDLFLDNKSIIKFCYEKKAEDEKGRTLTNKGGWQSNDLFLPVPELSQLTDTVTYLMRDFAKKINLRDTHRLCLDNFWININKKSNMNIPHSHPASVLSAAYYVKVPPKSGNIIFLTPFSIYDRCLEDYMIDSYTEYNSSTYTFIPQEGKLLLFPSWLEHKVEPNETDMDRISIAFNSGYY